MWALLYFTSILRVPFVKTCVLSCVGISKRLWLLTRSVESLAVGVSFRYFICLMFLYVSLLILCD